MADNFNNRIIHGDCIDVMRKMPDSSVDLIVTDPPYLVNYRSRDGRTIEGDIDSDWLHPASHEMYRILKPDSFAISFYGWNSVDKFTDAWREAGFRPVGHFTWTKDYASNRGFGYTRATHENAYLLAKGTPKMPNPALRDVLGWDYTGNHLHPTQKPVSALAPLIETYSQKGAVVLDPFAGSGTTAVASRQLGRQYIAIEKDRTYFEAARDRMAKEEGKERSVWQRYRHTHASEKALKGHELER